jgi:hypothetical protein
MAATTRKTAARKGVKTSGSTPSRRRHGRRATGLSAAQRKRIPAERFAFPKERKEPLNNASHVRNAIARFDQVEGVSEAERDAAWRRILAAARKFGVDVKVRGWRSLMKGGRSGR